MNASFIDMAPVFLLVAISDQLCLRPNAKQDSTWLLLGFNFRGVD